MKENNFNPNIEINKKNNKKLNNNNFPNLNKEKEIVKSPTEDKESNNNIKNNDDINYNMTPTGDIPELEKYYNELKNEKSENNNIKKIKSHNYKSELKSSFSFNKYKKAPNVILEIEDKYIYMNCILQCFANIRPIVCYYLKEIHNFKHHIKDMPLSYYFSRIIFHFYPYPENDLKKSFSLSTFQKVVSNLFNENSKTQTKIFDFLNFFLDSLHEDDKNIRNNKSNNEIGQKEPNENFKEYIQFLGQKEKSCILDNFCWLNLKVKKCLKCNKESIKYQKYFTYELDFEILKKSNVNFDKEISIFDWIKYQIQKQKILDYCNNCAKSNWFEIESLISISPQYFIFYISLNDEVIKKIGTKIKIDEEIDLSGLVKEQTIFNKYTLHGMILYDLDSQKFLSHCCSPVDGNWYSYLKDSISKLKKEKILTPSIYRLFPILFIYKQKSEKET